MSGDPSGQAEGQVTEAQRDAAIAALRAAAGDGVIDLEEFGERAGVVFGASRLDEIRAVLADLGPTDLPVPSPAASGVGLPPPPPPPPSDSQYVVAVMSGADRRGTWRAKSQVNAVAIMGGCKLDFRHAELSAPVTRVSAVTIMGGIDIVVPEGVPVEVDGFVLMGGVDDKTRSAGTPGAPMIRVSAAGMMGGVTVRHPRRRREGRQRDRLPSPDRALAPGDGTTDGTTVTLLWSELVGSTAMAESLGDHRWFEVLQSYGTVVRAQFDAHGGQVVQAQGDRFMVSFSSARRALRCAIAIQRVLVSHRMEHRETDLHVRIGLHSGEVIAANGDLFGRNVDLAARIAGEAESDEILVSAVTKQLAEAGGDLEFGAGRPAELHGFSGEWTIHEVRWA